MKKTVNVLLIICAFTLLSCSKKTEEKPVENEPVVFTMYCADKVTNPKFNDQIAKEITERTGVTLEISEVEESLSQDIQLMIANHNYPDFIFAKAEVSKLIENRAIIPLDEYIEKYGSNMKKLYGDQLDRLRNTIQDPHIYTFGTYEIKSNPLEVAGNIQLQNAVLREFGYPQIDTLDDLENILKAYVQKYPEIDGHKTYGMSLCTYDWYWLLGLSNPGNYMIGLQDDGQWYINPDNLSAQYKFLNPKMFTFYKWLNKIYHEGLLDPESFTQTFDMWKAKLSTGSVLSTSFAFWALQDIQHTLGSSDMYDRTFAYLPVTASPEYKDPALKDYGFSGGWGIGISVTCKDPVRAFKFMDYMCSEEAQVLTNWGIEGIDYFYDDYNRRLSAKIPRTTGVGRWTYPFPEAGTGYIDSTGNKISKVTRDSVIKKYNYAEKETLKAYGVEMWIDLFPSAQELGFSKHGQLWQYNLNSKCQDIVDACDDYVKKELIKMILGPEKNFDSSWSNMQKTVKDMGIGSVEKELTSLIKMKRTLWNY